MLHEVSELVQKVKDRVINYQTYVKQYQKTNRATAWISTCRHINTLVAVLIKHTKIQAPLTIPLSQASSKDCFGGMETCDGACHDIHCIAQGDTQTMNFAATAADLTQ